MIPPAMTTRMQARKSSSTVDDAVSSAVDELAGEKVDDGERFPKRNPSLQTSHEPLYDKDDLKLFAIDKEGKLYIYGAGERITSEGRLAADVFVTHRELNTPRERAGNA